MRKLLTLAGLLFLMACQSESGGQFPPKEVELITPSGEIIKTRLAITEPEQEKGLSGVREDEFSENEGMLFYYSEDGERHFWMPDTYFDLDIIYLNRELIITDIVRNLPHYIGKANPELIPRARAVWARHALEMKATSKISKNLKIGDKLKWQASISTQVLDEKIRAD